MQRLDFLALERIKVLFKKFSNIQEYRDEFLRDKNEVYNSQIKDKVDNWVQQ